MALDKAIHSGQEKRKPYRGSKAFACSCRNHGTCPWCHSNRTIQAQRAIQSIIDRAKLDDEFR